MYGLMNLENGIKVFLKQTKNNINSFEFTAQSLGGYSHASLNEYHSAKSTDDLINHWLGYGSFSRSEIKNKIDTLAGQKRLEEHKLSLFNEFINSL